MTEWPGPPHAIARLVAKATNAMVKINIFFIYFFYCNTSFNKAAIRNAAFAISRSVTTPRLERSNE